MFKKLLSFFRKGREDKPAASVIPEKTTLDSIKELIGNYDIERFQLEIEMTGRASREDLPPKVYNHLQKKAASWTYEVGLTYVHGNMRLREKYDFSSFHYPGSLYVLVAEKLSRSRALKDPEEYKHILLKYELTFSTIVSTLQESEKNNPDSDELIDPIVEKIVVDLILAFLEDVDKRTEEIELEKKRAKEAINQSLYKRLDEEVAYVNKFIKVKDEAWELSVTEDLFSDSGKEHIWHFPEEDTDEGMGVFNMVDLSKETNRLAEKATEEPKTKRAYLENLWETKLQKHEEPKKQDPPSLEHFSSLITQNERQVFQMQEEVEMFQQAVKRMELDIERRLIRFDKHDQKYGHVFKK